MHAMCELALCMSCEHCIDSPFGLEHVWFSLGEGGNFLPRGLGNSFFLAHLPLFYCLAQCSQSLW